MSASGGNGNNSLKRPTRNGNGVTEKSYILKSKKPAQVQFIEPLNCLQIQK